MRKCELTSRKCRNALYLILAAFNGAAFWVVGVLMHRGEPLSALAVFRAGDSQNYPVIKALSLFRTSDIILFEAQGRHVLSAPFSGLVLHAALFRLCGVFGFILADMAIAALCYLAVNFMLRCAGVRSGAREPAALLMCCCSFTGWLHTLSAPLWRGFMEDPNIFWSFRIPRPFVSELFVAVCLGFFFLFLFEPGRMRRARNWIFLGLAHTALLQSDIYTYQAVSVCIPAMAALMMVFHREHVVAAVKGFLIFAVVSVAFSAPFLMQRAMENPDVAVRYGMFGVEGVPWGEYASFLPVAALSALAALCALTSFFFKPGRNERKILLAAFAAGALAAMALPVSILLIKKTVQPYHFPIATLSVMKFSFLICALYVFQEVSTRVGKRAEAGNPRIGFSVSMKFLRPAAAWLFPALILFLMLLYPVRNEHEMSEFRVRGQDSLSDYRADFDELAGRLQRERKSGALVLGTFDLYVYTWWITFGDGWAYTPDTFTATVPDSEIERRLMLLCRALGADDEQFLSFIKDKMTYITWLANDKYQASRGHTFAPLSDYGAKTRNAIKNSIFIHSWNTAIPNSELKRLAAAYRATAYRQAVDSGPRLDLIVLTNEQRLSGFSPSREAFTLIFSNSSFRVFRRNAARR